MSPDKSASLFTIGDDLLIAAQHENDRAAEDVVTHLICVNSRQSISNYLAGFLIRKNIEVIHPVSLASLLQQCKSVDARFDSLDLSQMYCREHTHDKDYCLGQEQVEECIKVAQHARSIVMSDTPAY